MAGMTRVCATCLVEKPIHAFRRRRRVAHPLKRECRPCRAGLLRAIRQKRRSRGIIVSRVPHKVLRFMARSEFARNYFPQEACVGCVERPACTTLLADQADHEQNFWLVRGEWRCARNYQKIAPLDVFLLRRRLMAMVS